MKTSIVKKWKHAAKRKTTASAVNNHPTSAQLDAESESFELWLKHELKYDAYRDLLFLGLEAFVMTGKLMTESELSTVFPSSEDGIEALKQFVWDVTRNDCRLTIRLSNELGW